MASGVCVARCNTIFKIDFRRFGLKTLASAQQTNKETWSRRGRRYASTTSSNNATNSSDTPSLDSKDLLNKTSVKRTPKTQRGQYELFVKLMENSNELQSKSNVGDDGNSAATGDDIYNTNQYKKDFDDEKWLEVAITLNSYKTGPKKSSVEWKKTLTKWKQTLTARYKKLLVQEGSEIGLPSECLEKLNDVELRALALWGLINAVDKEYNKVNVNNETDIKTTCEIVDDNYLIDDENYDYVTVKYIRGLPNVVVPLPSRNEKCQFALRPVSHCVGDFIDMIRAEDKGIDRATILNSDGVRIAAACSIENLMDDEFWLHVNDKRYLVKPPERAKISMDEISKVGDVRALVAQLYEVLNVGEHQIKKERELSTRLEELTVQLQPFEKIQNDLADTSERRTSMLTWVGLGMMGVQFGILARLTWWEYSWDIMEPVTYFVTYGTAMAAYAYYCLTKQEYNLPDVKDRQYLITMYKKAKKRGFDVHEYNHLKREVAEIEHDLRRLRDPLYIRYSPTPTSICDSTTVKGIIPSAKNFLGIKSNDSKINFSSILESATKKLKK